MRMRIMFLLVVLLTLISCKGDRLPTMSVPNDLGITVEESEILNVGLETPVCVVTVTKDGDSIAPNFDTDDPNLSAVFVVEFFHKGQSVDVVEKVVISLLGRGETSQIIFSMDAFDPADTCEVKSIRRQYYSF